MLWAPLVAVVLPAALGNRATLAAQDRPETLASPVCLAILAHPVHSPTFSPS